MKINIKSLTWWRANNEYLNENQTLTKVDTKENTNKLWNYWMEIRNGSKLIQEKKDWDFSPVGLSTHKNLWKIIDVSKRGY